MFLSNILWAVQVKPNNLTGTRLGQAKWTFTTSFRASQIILDEIFDNQIQVKPNGVLRLVLGQAKSF